MKNYSLITLVFLFACSCVSAGQEGMKAISPIPASDIETFLQKKEIPLNKCMMWARPYVDHKEYAAYEAMKKLRGTKVQNTPFTREDILNPLLLLCYALKENQKPLCLIATQKELKDAQNLVVAEILSQDRYGTPDVPGGKRNKLTLFDDVFSRYPEVILLISLRDKDETLDRKLMMDIYAAKDRRRVQFIAGSITTTLDPSKMYVLPVPVLTPPVTASPVQTSRPSSPPPQQVKQAAGVTSPNRGKTPPKKRTNPLDDYYSIISKRSQATTPTDQNQTSQVNTPIKTGDDTVELSQRENTEPFIN